MVQSGNIDYGLITKVLNSDPVGASGNVDYDKLASSIFTSYFAKRAADVIVFQDDSGNAIAINNSGQVIAGPSTDHASVIQEAINSLTNGGKIYIGVGEYNISNVNTLPISTSYLSNKKASIIIYNKNNIIIEGDATIYFKPITNDGYDYILFLILQSDNINIHGLNMVGQQTGDGAVTGIWATSSTNIIIENNKVDMGQTTKSHAIVVSTDPDLTNTKHIKIINNYLRSYIGDVIAGGSNPPTVVEDIIIQSNSIEQIGDGTSSYNSFDMVKVYNVRLIDNQLYGHVVFGPEQTPNTFSIIALNNIKPAENDTYVKVSLASSLNPSQRVKVINNIIEHGFIDIYAKDSIIANNIILNDVQTNSIFDHSGNENNVIEGNVVVLNYSGGVGIRIQGSNVVVLGNRVNVLVGDYGVLQDAGKSLIVGNIISGSFSQGTRIYNSEADIVSNRIIGSGSGYGILLVTSNGSVKDNYLEGLAYGIYLDASSTTTNDIANNRFSNVTTITTINNYAKLTRNSSKSTFSGDGSTTQFTIAHGLVSAPSKVLVTPCSADASGNFYVTADSTNIYVNYNTAPPSGTDNVCLNWYAEV